LIARYTSVIERFESRSRRSQSPKTSGFTPAL
jgi:hypothetical protein